MQFHRKYWDFVYHKAPAEFLEGTTASGKTVAAVFKFMLEVADSPRRQHVIASETVGTAEKNIINSDAGLFFQFGDHVQYNGSGDKTEKLAHILYDTPGGVKVIYVLGYNDKKRWTKALGGQLGCALIDEINTADVDFVQEVAMRCDYLLGTLNPDDPNLPVYDQYINCSRPLPQYAHDTPPEILDDLKRVSAKPGWVHWFFTFDHNVWLTDEKREQIIASVPPGTKRYKNKIQGLRGKSEGLIFDLQKRHIITAEQAAEYKYKRFTCGVDTSYSRLTDDKIAIVFSGITVCRKHIQLAELVMNNQGRAVRIAPSDMPGKIIPFLEQQREAWGFTRNVFIDNEDAGTISECEKYKRLNGCLYDFVPAWKKMKVLDRLTLEAGWLARGDCLIVDSCRDSIQEMNAYSWKEDKGEPEARNDHTVNARQYDWLPYKDEIGVQKNGKAG